MPTRKGEEDWSQQMQEEEDERHAFSDSVKVPRTPAKKHDSPSAEIHAAPRKPAAKARAEESEEPSTPTRATSSSSTQQGDEITETVEIVKHADETSPAKKPMKTLLKVAIGMVKRAQSKLSAQRTHGAPSDVKNEVMAHFEEIVEFMEAIRAVEDEMTSVKRVLQDIKQTIKASEKAAERSWVAIAATPKATPAPHGTHPSRRDNDEKSQQEQTKRRLERAKFEVTLTAEGHEESRNQVQRDNHVAITDRLQAAIKQNNNGTEPTPTILGVQKLKSSDIRIRCGTENEAKRLREIDWMKAYPGVEVRRPKYGVVIHGVLVDEIDPFQDNMEEHTRDIETQNEKLNLKIARLRTLKAPSKLNPHARYTSFVIQTHHPEAADKCLKSGVHYNCRLYPAEKHTPQLQLTQCFKCQKWGHRASQCRGKETCGKCSDKHATNSCARDEKSEAKCANCGDNNPAWHRDCPHRMSEITRIDDMKFETKTAYFNE